MLKIVLNSEGKSYNSFSEIGSSGGYFERSKKHLFYAITSSDPERLGKRLLAENNIGIIPCNDSLHRANQHFHEHEDINAESPPSSPGNHYLSLNLLNSF